jgi:hypothetical protein
MREANDSAPGAQGTLRPSSPIVIESERVLEIDSYDERTFQVMLHDLRAAAFPHALRPSLNPPTIETDITVQAPISGGDENSNFAALGDSTSPERAPGTPQTEAALYIGIAGRRSFLELLPSNIPHDIAAIDLIKPIIEPRRGTQETLSGRIIGKMGRNQVYIGKSRHIFDIAQHGWSAPLLGFVELGLLQDVLDGVHVQSPYRLVTPAVASEQRSLLLSSNDLPEDTRVYMLYLYREVCMLYLSVN